MRLLIGLLIISSIAVAFALSGCGTIIQRPDSWVCGVNAAAKPAKLRCYNLKSDYNDDGTRRPDAKPYEIFISELKDLQGWTCVDPKSLENLKVFIADMRDEIQRRCQ